MGLTIEAQPVFVDQFHDLLQGLARVCHVIDDQYLLAIQSRNIHERRQNLRFIQSLTQTGIELKVHGTDGLHTHCVGNCSRGDQATARNCNDQVGLPPGVHDLLCQLACGVAEFLPGQIFAFFASVGRCAVIEWGGSRHVYVLQQK